MGNRLRDLSLLSLHCLISRRSVGVDSCQGSLQCASRYPFAGQMHLCNFGASIQERSFSAMMGKPTQAASIILDQDCPDAPNCMGPGGTSLSYPRMYDYEPWRGISVFWACMHLNACSAQDIWSTRGFLKQSMQAAVSHELAACTAPYQTSEALFPHLKSSIDGSVDPGEQLAYSFCSKLLAVGIRHGRNRSVLCSRSNASGDV